MVSKTDPWLEITFALQVPRLSTVIPSATVDVSVVGTVKESLLGLLVIGVRALTYPEESTQENRRLKAGSTPSTFTQTASPKLNSVCGVVQSAAKVPMLSAMGSTCDRSDGNVPSL